MASYSAMKAGLRNLWNQAQVTRTTEVEREAKGILDDKELYQQVERDTGVPWFVIALIHMRESSRNFGGILHNGERIIGTGQLTKLVPKGRGPFNSWGEAALDALTVEPHDLVNITDWPLERCLYEMERWNGFGYAQHKINSPYMWAGTNHYSKGKYVSDGRFDPNHVDMQLGCAAVLKKLEAMDAEVAAQLAGEPVPAPVPEVPTDLSQFSNDQLIAELLKRPLVTEVIVTHAKGN